MPAIRVATICVELDMLVLCAKVAITLGSFGTNRTNIQRKIKDVWVAVILVGVSCSSL